MKKHERKTRIISSVIASRNPTIAKDLKVKAHLCGGCGLEFATNAAKPFCHECGSEDVDAINTSLPIENIKPEDEAALSSIRCPSCQVCNILTDAKAAELGGTLNCVTCGSELQYAIEAESDEELDLTDDTEEDSDIGGDQIGNDDAEVSMEDGMDEEVDEEFSETTDDVVDEDTEVEESTEDGDEDDVVFDEDPVEESSDDSDEDDVETEESTDDMDGDDNEEEDMDEVTMSLVDLAKIQSGEQKVRFLRVGAKNIIAFVGDLNVARLHVAEAEDNEDIFEEESFLKAIKSSYVNNGLERTLKDFNFKVASVSVSKAKVMAHAAEKATKEATAKVQSELKDAKAVLVQSFGIAASGLNKSHFKAHGHALKESLYDELSNLGIRNPSAIIDKVFASASDAYNTTLIDLAFDIMERPEDIRNHLAEAIGDSNYQTAEVDDFDDDEEDTEANVVESRLSSGIVGTPTKVVASVTAIRKNLGGRLF